MNPKEIIAGAITVVIGVILIPLIAIFTETANNSGGNSSVSPVRNVTGLTTLTTLFPYIFAFVVIFAGVGLMVHGKNN